MKNKNKITTKKASADGTDAFYYFVFKLSKCVYKL